MPRSVPRFSPQSLVELALDGGGAGWDDCALRSLQEGEAGGSRGLMAKLNMVKAVGTSSPAHRL